jgi:hypothetical protein
MERYTKVLIDVTLFLASRGSPFQGDNTGIDDVNKNIFLSTLEISGSL